jgi:hypothetical protein
MQRGSLGCCCLVTRRRSFILPAADTYLCVVSYSACALIDQSMDNRREFNIEQCLIKGLKCDLSVIPFQVLPQYPGRHQCKPIQHELSHPLSGIHSQGVQ